MKTVDKNDGPDTSRGSQVISIAELEDEARALAEGELWSQAARHLTRAARRDPADTARWLQIVNWQREAREPLEAAQTLELALKMTRALKTPRANAKDAASEKASSLAALLFALAEVQLEAQRWDECADTCRSLLEISPRHHAGLEILATAFLHGGRVDDAVEAMQALLRVSPRDPLHRLKYATLLQLQGESGASLNEFERVVTWYPESPFSDEAREAIELLDHMQTQQILLRASEESDFRLQLHHSLDDTLQNHGFYLSDNGRENLRSMIGDGRPDREIPMRIH
jgi:tetratricopeptide (TPR) repeat protein